MKFCHLIQVVPDCKVFKYETIQMQFLDNSGNKVGLTGPAIVGKRQIPREAIFDIVFMWGAHPIEFSIFLTILESKSCRYDLLLMAKEFESRDVSKSGMLAEFEIMPIVT